MRILSIHIADYRGITATIPLAGAVVMFGPNDAGKTNILDAIESGLAGTTPRVDRHHPRDPHGAGLALEFELAGLDVEGSADQEFVYHWAGSWQNFEDLFSTEDAVNEELVESLKARLLEQVSDFPDPGDEHRSERVAAFIEDFKQVLHTYDIARNMRPAELVGSARFFHWPGGGSVFLRVGDRTRPIGWEEEPLARVVRNEPESSAALEEDILAVLRTHWGGVEGMPDRVDDAAPLLDRQRRGGPGWLEREGDWVRVHPDVVEACTRLGEEATELAAAFVRERYRIEIVPTSPMIWREHGGRISVRVVPRDGSEEEGFDLSVASSGVATWVGYAVAEAIRRRRLAGSLSEDIRSAALPTIYLIDEPERHLHPVAQLQAAEWLADVARGGAWVVVATHAIPFLRFPLEEDVEYIRVTRGPDWTTQARSISHAVLAEVQESASELGVPPAALIQLVRGWLVVEGENDKTVLERIFGDLLGHAGRVILCLQGHGQLKASFLDLQALRGLGIPFSLLLDDTRQEAIRSSKPVPPRSDGEHLILELRTLYRDEEEDVRLLPFPWPDIICALPEQALNSLCEARGARQAFPGWSDLVKQHDPRATHRGVNFKRFALDYLSIDGVTNATALIDAALEHWDGDLPADHPLKKPIDDMLEGTALTL